MKILGVETSCDETAAAVVEDGVHILSNVVASQIDIHARYGGVVPEVASRQHLLSILPVLREAMAGLSFKELSAVAVTVGPGLPGSLLVGANVAKALALAHGLPLIGINHLEAHVYANWLERKEPPLLPALCLIVSGGHTDLILMRGHGSYSLLGRTRDDAVGEAFDKVARILGLGYPGGPAVEKAALEGDPSHFPLPRAWLKGSDDFSFSGLKTAVLHLVQEKGIEAGNKKAIADIASSFQQSVVEVLVAKAIAAAERHGVKQILLAGGVAANQALSSAVTSRSSIAVHCPRPALCTDNAAMVASSGYFRLLAGRMDGWDLDVFPNLSLG